MSHVSLDALNAVHSRVADGPLLSLAKYKYIECKSGDSEDSSQLDTYKLASTTATQKNLYIENLKYLQENYVTQ